MTLFRRLAAGVLAAMCLPSLVHARPVLFAHSTTFMAEYCEDVMQEAQLFYAPSSRWSFGLGHMELLDIGANHEHEANYARVNLLLKRWNLEAAQANIFAWGGAGRSSVTVTPSPTPAAGGHSHGPPVVLEPYTFEETTWNSGGQIDFETRRIYLAASSDAHYSSTFLHRTDTLQIGFAPYAHEVDGLATWVLLSASHYDGDIRENTQVALLLRLFRKNTWVEAGATLEGRPLARLMFSF